MPIGIIGRNTPRLAPPKRRRWLLWVFGSLLGVVLIVVATVAITLWWIQRPIKPVFLSTEEKKVVEAKLQQARGAPVTTRDNRFVPSPNPNSNVTSNRYVAGGKELRLTERELNGLLNENTELGNRLRLELDTDAVNAYIAVPIPKDFRSAAAGRFARADGSNCL